MAFDHSSSHHLGVPSVDLLVFVSTCAEAFKKCRASRSLAKTGFVALGISTLDSVSICGDKMFIT